jgi:uncharacterized protein
VKDLVEMVARGLASRPEEVAVSEVSEGDAVTLELTVSPEDLGRVIGREGRTARALRALASAAGHKHSRRVTIRIKD